MTQEQKEILLKDLCARLPYGLKFAIGEMYLTEDMVKGGYDKIQELYGITHEGNVELLNMDYHMPVESIKPYLFPLSSMTDEQKYDFYCRFIENDCVFDDFKEFYLDGGMWHKLLTSLDDIEAIIDWFHKNHFDYRGLIDNELAIDATGLNIY